MDGSDIKTHGQGSEQPTAAVRGANAIPFLSL